MKASLFVLPWIALLSACGSSDTSTVTLPDGKGGSTTVSSKTDGDISNMSMTGADGKTVTISSDVKGAKFPAYAPQYPGSTVTSATNMTSEGSTMQTVIMSSDGAVGDVVTFYKDSVTKAGMPIGMSGDINGIGTLQAGKGDKQPAVVVSAAPKDGKTEISLILTTAG